MEAMYRFDSIARKESFTRAAVECTAGGCNGSSAAPRGRVVIVLPQATIDRRRRAAAAGGVLALFAHRATCGRSHATSAGRRIFGEACAAASLERTTDERGGEAARARAFRPIRPKSTRARHRAVISNHRRRRGAVDMGVAAVRGVGGSARFRAVEVPFTAVRARDTLPVRGRVGARDRGALRGTLGEGALPRLCSGAPASAANDRNQQGNDDNGARHARQPSNFWTAGSSR